MIERRVVEVKNEGRSLRGINGGRRGGGKRREKRERRKRMRRCMVYLDGMIIYNE